MQRKRAQQRGHLRLRNGVNLPLEPFGLAHRGHPIRSVSVIVLFTISEASGKIKASWPHTVKKQLYTHKKTG
jgi:hypothetical protein